MYRHLVHTGKVADIRSGEWFQAARERGFVGRRQESALFGALLARGAGSVLFVHGPGGIGKTTLLHHFAHLAGRDGRETALLDARDVLLPEACTGTGLGPEVHNPGSVLLLDAAEGLPEEVLRQELPGLPLPDLVTVLAARNAPPVAWRVDPAWQDLLHSLPLGPLDPEDSLRLLRGRGVHEQSGEHRILAFARGHPLALALAADVGAQGGVPGHLSPADSPQLVRALLDCLLEAVPSPLHRTAPHWRPPPRCW